MNAKSGDALVKALFALFFVPYIIMAVGETPNHPGSVMDLAYRGAQLAWAGCALLIALTLSQTHGLKMSGVGKFLALYVGAMVLIHFGMNAVSLNPEYRWETLQLAAMFLSMIVGLDLIARRFAFSEFAAWAAPAAMAMLVLTAIHLTFFASYHFGRANYFDLHPNLGGEVLIGTVALVAFWPQPLVRFIAYGVAAYCFIELESRAALIGAVIIVAIAELPRTAKFWRDVGIFIALAIVAACAVALFNLELVENLLRYIENDVLRLNDAYRGVGTGFVGRDDTWGYAMQVLAERPIIGSGLNNSGATDMGLGIHSGYLKNMAEFGMTGVMLNILILISVPLAFRRDWRLGAVMAGCAVVYIFNARNINLNIYPLMMWIALLPWLPERARRSPLPGAADGPKWRAGKLMPRLGQPAER